MIDPNEFQMIITIQALWSLGALALALFLRKERLKKWQ